QAEDGIRDRNVTGVQTCALPISDFDHLYRNYGVQVQIGGSDQWGNITTGLEVLRKTHEEEVNAYGFTIPLVTKADGTKFGKTAEIGRASCRERVKDRDIEECVQR